jgi:pimeloyl-ACP methyl ester carboxylesterase
MIIDSSPHTLCLSGWAQHHDALDALCDTHTLHTSYASLSSVQHTLTFLQQHAPHPQRTLGWSLGGALAMHAITHGALHTKQLVLTFSLFQENYQRDALRTAKRFSHLITKGDMHHQHIAANLADAEFSAQQHAWQPWLHHLRTQHHSDYIFTHFPPTLIIHGAQDEVVSIEQARWLAQRIPHATLIELEQCGHAPHLHDTPRIKALIDDHAQAHQL